MGKFFGSKNGKRRSDEGAILEYCLGFLVQIQPDLIETVKKIVQKMAEPTIDLSLYRRLKEILLYLVEIYYKQDYQAYEDAWAKEWLRPQVRAEKWDCLTRYKLPNLVKYFLIEECAAYFKFSELFLAQCQKNDQNLAKHIAYVSKMEIVDDQRELVIALLQSLNENELQEYAELWEIKADGKRLSAGKLPQVKVAIVPIVLDQIAPKLVKDPAKFMRRIEKIFQDGKGELDFLFWEQVILEYKCRANYLARQKELFF